MQIAKDNVNDFLLDFQRLMHMLKRFHQRILLKALHRPSPFSIPILTTFTSERIQGQAEEEVLYALEREIEANELMEEVKKHGCE